MTILYTNGCSYTANLRLEKTARYPSLLAWNLKWHLKDNSWPGSSNARIIRCTYKDCVRLKTTSSEKIVALIQLTHLFRTEIFNPTVKDNDWLDQSDPFTSIKPIDKDLPADQYQVAQWFLKTNTDESLLLGLLPQLLGLTSFFKQNQIDYLIYFGPKENCETISDNILFKELQKDNHVLDLAKFNMLDLTGKQMHPDAGGMQKIFEFFYPMLANFTDESD